LVKELGYSAVAREIGLTPTAVRKRVLRILGEK
jgi:DNA-binding Lrp family transcriptional regulator